MNLTQYLKTTDEYHQAYKFAERAGVSVQAVYDLISMEKQGKRRRNVLLETALKIRAASDNLISLEDLGKPCDAEDPQIARLQSRPPGEAP